MENLPLHCNMTKSSRITVRPHNVEFLKSIAAQMRINDIAEVLNYLLLDIKGLNYRYGDKPAPVTQTAPLGFDSRNFETAFVPNLDSDHNERNHVEIDPVISRLANLLEEF